MADWYRLDALGERAFVVTLLEGRPAYGLARACRSADMPGLTEVVPAYDACAFHHDGSLPEGLLREAVEDVRDFEPPSGKSHDLPCLYEGPDLEQVAKLLGIDVSEVVALHAGRTYTCFAVGFQPGFPYLGWLPEELARLPRRPSPRVRVPARSVAIAGRQTGVYPDEGPGGWWLIGETPLAVCEPARLHFPIAAGDQVRFLAVDRDAFARSQGAGL